MLIHVLNTLGRGLEQVVVNSMLLLASTFVIGDNFNFHGFIKCIAFTILT
jgi:uncharacterized membrane protein YvlD (DUF360 family)